MYYPIEEVRVDKGALLRKLDPDIHAGLRSPADLFEKGSGELLVKEGAKLNKTLMGRIRSAGIKEIPIKQEDLVGRAVLTELVDPGTQEVILEKNQRLTAPVMERILESGVEGFKVIYLDSPTTSPVILDTLEAERTNSKEEAWVEIYKRLRPGEMPSIESAKLLFENLFLNPKRYDLSPVGRLKLNKRFTSFVNGTEDVIRSRYCRSGEMFSGS